MNECGLLQRIKGFTERYCDKNKIASIVLKLFSYFALQIMKADKHVYVIK